MTNGGRGLSTVTAAVADVRTAPAPPPPPAATASAAPAPPPAATTSAAAALGPAPVPDDFDAGTRVLLERLGDVVGRSVRFRRVRTAGVRRLLRVETRPGSIRVRPVGSKVTATIVEGAPGAFVAAVGQGSPGVMRAYVDGAWATDDLYQVMSALFAGAEVLRRLQLVGAPIHLLRRAGADHPDHAYYADVALHYDLPRTLFARFLGPDLAYSAAKTRLGGEPRDTYLDVLRRLALPERAVIADLGAGWGAFSGTVLRSTPHRVHAVTLSAVQATAIRDLAPSDGGRLTVVVGNVLDPATLPDHADAVVMIESIEHLTAADRRRLLDDLRRRYPHASLVLQATTRPSLHVARRTGRTALNSAVFPGPGVLPSLRSLRRDLRVTGWSVDEVADLTAEYHGTVLEWMVRWRDQPRPRGMDERTFRFWEIYLTGLAAALACDHIRSYHLICRPPSDEVGSDGVGVTTT